MVRWNRIQFQFMFSGASFQLCIVPILIREVSHNLQYSIIQTARGGAFATASLALVALIVVKELVHLAQHGAILQHPQIQLTAWQNAQTEVNAIELQQNACARVTLKARHVKGCHAQTIARVEEGAFLPRHWLVCKIRVLS